MFFFKKEQKRFFLKKEAKTSVREGDDNGH